ncbi:MAG: hypothetical protein ACF8Q5_11600 [Phycisphaerales bacterium JB040]
MIDVIFALLLALLLASLLTWPVGWRYDGTDRTGESWVFGLLLFFPLLWLAGLWLPPLGPPLAGGYWVGPLVFGLLMILLIAAAAPASRATRRKRSRGPAAPPPESPDRPERVTTGIFLDLMFWMLVLGTIALIVIGYTT